MTAAKPITPSAPSVPTGSVEPFAGDDFDRDVWSVFGLPIDVATAPDAVIAIERAARDRVPLSFVTPNVNFLVRALKDEEARRHLIDADLSFVDGAPLVALGRLLGVPLKERCAGSDVFEALRRRPGFAGRRLRVFFFGGRDGSAAAAAAAIDAEQRGLQSAGFFNPGAGDIESMSTDEIIAKVNAANADFILVALGAAKGQAWIDKNRARLSAPVIAHLGAVIDFTAGAIGRAPKWVRRAGLEWAWRIKEEPALWRRYRDDAAGLARIILRRLPAALARGGRKGAPARAEVSRDARGVVLVLSGDLEADGLSDLRRAFRAASAEGRDVALDLENAGAIDAAFLGLLLMLEKNLRAKGAGIAVRGASRAHRRLLAAHGLSYPEETAAPAAEGGIAASA